MSDPAKTIAFQGAPGAYSDLACRNARPEMATLPCHSFKDAFAAVRGNAAEFAMIPIENSVAGRVAGPDGSKQARHIAVSVFARGVLVRLATRLYFRDDDGLADDPVLAHVPADRRHTLIAQPSGDGIWQFDIALGGDDETVFFDL